MDVIRLTGNKSTRVDLEWVVIPKRRIYLLITLMAAALVALLGGLYLWLAQGNAAHAPGKQPSAEGARFGAFEGSVTVIRADTREILVADSNTRLYAGDTVQTHADGRASMTLADGSTLSISPDSVITIAENSATQEDRHGHVRVAVEGGQVRMRTDNQTVQMSSVVETPLAINRLRAQTAATFDVLEDRSEEIRVKEGTVETKMLEGQTKIHAGEYVALNKLGHIKRREQLLEAPVPYAPLNSQVMTAHESGTARVALQWTSPHSPADVSYQVDIALSPFFVRRGILFERDELVAPKLVLTAFRPGSYFWRVRAVSARGQASQWCEPQTFSIRRSSASTTPQQKAVKQ